MSAQPSLRMIPAIMLALLVWGIYLAIGATGLFVDETLFDPVRSVWVLFFVFGFLGLWALVVRAIARRDALETIPSAPQWSVAALTSMTLMLAGVISWVGAVASWRMVSPLVTTLLGWAAAMLLGGATVAGMMALSSRQPRRGKWLGALGMMASFVAIVAFFARMRP